MAEPEQHNHDYQSLVSSLTVTRCGEIFNCHLYASGHLKVSHARLGFLVETAGSSEPQLLLQVERMATALLMREWDPDTPFLRTPARAGRRRRAVVVSHGAGEPA